jgi:hypothetical protein
MGYRNISLLMAIDQRTTQMALDLSKVTASEEKLVADVERLLAVAADTQKALDDLRAQTNDPAVQNALDAITAALEAEAVRVEGVVPPGPPITVTGATGP